MTTDQPSPEPGPILDVAALLAPRVQTTVEPHEIPGVGTILVRATTRAEAIFITKAKTTSEREMRILVAGVANPVLTMQDAQAWYQSGHAGELGEVVRHIVRLSGLEEKADKEAYRRFRAEPV